MNVLSKFTAYSFLSRSTVERHNWSIQRKNSLSCSNRKVSKRELEQLEREIEFYSFVLDLLEDFRSKGYFYDKEVKT